MTDDLGSGVLALQALYQLAQGAALGGGAGVLRTAVAVQAALIADAQRVLVVALGMCAGQLLVAGLGDGTVALDIVVVGGESEALAVVTQQLHQRIAPVLPRRRTMNNDKVDATHGFKLRIKS